MQVAFVFKCNYGIIIHHFLLLGNTVTPFLRFICINVLNKSSVFGLFTEAEPCMACPTAGPSWQSCSRSHGRELVRKVLLPKLMAEQSVPKVATGPATARCQPMCSLAEGFSLCPSGDIPWKWCPRLLSMHSADRSKADSRCGEKEL